MKVCIFTSSLDKKGGGPSRSVPILVKGLAELGCDVKLLVVESDDMNTHVLESTAAKVEILPKDVSKNELKSALLRGNYDIVHAQGIWVPIYHRMAAILHRHGIPYIMTPRGALEPWCLNQKKIKKLIAMFLYQRKDLQEASTILATAEMEAQHIRDLGITAPIAVIPNGIDINEYKCRPKEYKYRVKKQILFLSRIHEKKGIEILIAAWERLFTTFPDWSIVIAGNGEESYIKQLKDVIKEKELDHVISIIPPVFGEEKYRLYCESSLFVLPSYSENFGMVVAEAMSCGLPVITTNGTPWQELNNLHLGWCIDLCVDNLVCTIAKSISMGDDALFEIGQKASRYIETTYHYLSVAEQNKDVYDRIVNKVEKPRCLI